MIGRRNFCALIGSAVVGAGVARPAVSGVSAPVTPAERLSSLRAMTDAEAARAVARQLPADGDVGITPEASAERIVSSLDAVPTGRNDLRERVIARIRQDYSEGRTLMVAGWSLTVTEARLAALWRDA